ncbi:MAG: sigma-70 family RNA polymerase sigma factor [Planctomycetes bacterium]|nr:sigma-70 family RNA polymerase sigma factor [Planctomycetota bacterium]
MPTSFAQDSRLPPSTSTGLLDRARARDPEGWRRLSSVYGPAVYGWARHCGLQPADAADVVQEVFAAVWRKIDGFRKDRPGDTFRGWLWTIARNKIRDHFRRLESRPAAAGGSDARRLLEQMPELSAVEPPAASAQAGGGVVRRALELVQSEFEPRSWQAFWRAAVEQQKPVDVAADLGMTVAAVYKAKSRVLRRVRAELEGLLE